MAEGQGNFCQQDNTSVRSQVQQSPEMQRQSCDTSAEKFIVSPPNVKFPKVPVQPESSQCEASSSSEHLSSPVFQPRRRRLRSECSDSEEDEKPVESTSADDKDASHAQFRRRTNAVGAKNMHKRKKVS